jgi:hypothetical protein
MENLLTGDALVAFEFFANALPATVNRSRVTMKVNGGKIRDGPTCT